MSASNLTENDQRILALAWRCFTDMPKVDYRKLAELGGYKTPASATTAYLNARKKLVNGNNPPAVSTALKSNASAPTTPKAAGKKRAATETPGEGTAKKRGRKSKAEMQAVAATEADADDEKPEEETTIKGETDVEDDGMEKFLSGAQEFVDGGADGKSEKTEDA